MLPAVVALTVVVVTVKFTDDEPAGTVAEPGTEAAGFALVKLTTAPLAGPAPVRVTVPVADWPPVTDPGLTLTEFNAAGPTGAGL